MVKDGVLDATAADSLKPVDVFYIYPTVTGFRPESYHLHDYGFFFNNFKQNVADRVKAYMEK